MDPGLIVAIGTLLLGGSGLGVALRLMDKRYDTDMGRARQHVVDAKTAQSQAEADRDKERAERERWWQAWTDEREAHLETRTKMQDLVDGLEDQVRKLTIKVEHQDRTIAEQSQRITDLTAQVQALGGSGT